MLGGLYRWWALSSFAMVAQAELATRPALSRALGLRGGAAQKEQPKTGKVPAVSQTRRARRARPPLIRTDPRRLRLPVATDVGHLDLHARPHALRV